MASPVKEVAVTDTIAIPDGTTVRPAVRAVGRRAALQGDPIHAREQSVSSLFD